MIESTPLTKYLVAGIAAMLLGSYLHEFSHWFVGWIGDTNPEIKWSYLMIPNEVNHGDIETMDSTIIRLSGVSIFVWIPPGVLSLLYLLFDFTPVRLFIALIPISVILMTTESDVVAIREPERFRQKWMENDFQRNAVFIPDWLDADWLPDI